LARHNRRIVSPQTLELGDVVYADEYLVMVYSCIFVTPITK